MIQKLCEATKVRDESELKCIACWFDEWFECDDEVGSAIATVAIMGHGRQPLDCHKESRTLLRALAVRHVHYMRRPKPECSCDLSPADPVADFHAACAKLNDAPQRDVNEVCDDMAEFLANMKPKWYVLKDEDQLVEAALETGLVRDLGG